MSLKKQTIAGLKWSFIQQFSVQIINFSVQIFLARLLMPEMFGLIAMVIILISIGQLLIDGGMTSSLIRTNQPTQVDYSTVFIINFLTSIFIYIGVYKIAPYMALFYNQEVLVDIIRILALTFVIRALAAVHVAKLTKEMNFKLQMQVQVPSTLISGGVGVYLASKGYEVWSLVWMNIIQAIAFTLLTWWRANWKPTFDFSWERFKYHFNFGYKLTIAGLIDTIFNDIYKIVIGKYYTATQLGYFHQAEQLRLFPVSQISTVVDKVTYPLFSSISNEDNLKNSYKITMQLLLFVTVPLMLSLILVAEEVFFVLLGDKWLSAVYIFQVLAIASIFRPVSTYNLNILKVKGRSDIFLKLEIFKKIVGILFLFLGLNFGFHALVWSLLAFSFFSYIINMFVSGKLINYTMKNQLKDSSLFFLIGLGVYMSLFFLKKNLEGFIQNDLIVIFFYIGFFYILNYFIIFLFNRDIYKFLLTLKK